MALLLLALTLAVGGALSQTTTSKPGPADFVTVLNGLGNYSSILGLINAAGLTDTLLQVPELTLFLPTDEAISKLPADQVQALQNNPQQLLDVLGYHAVVGRQIKINNKKHDRTYMTYNNKTVRINIYKTAHKKSVEGVEIVEEDIPVANGYVQGINGIMVPPAGNIVDIVAGRNDMTTLASLLTQAGLIDAIRADENMTVFAPTDAAFANVNPNVTNYLVTHPDALKEVLLFHVVKKETLYSIGMRHAMSFPTANGHHDRVALIEDFAGNVFIDNAKVTEVDISATNGVVHVIDSVLFPTKAVLEIENAGIMLG